MTLTKHQELVKIVEAMAMRVLAIWNPVDKKIMTEALRHLIEYQILTSKGIEND